MKGKLLLAVIACLILLVHVAAFADEQIAAKVNGTALFQRELEGEVEQLIRQEFYHKSVSDETRLQLRSRALKDMIKRELIVQDAQKRGIKPDEKKVDEQMESVRGRFKSKSDYKSALAAANVTEKELRDRFTKNVLVERAIAETVTVAAAASDEELKAYYANEEYAAKFVQPERMRVRIISSKSEKKIRKAIDLLRAGDDFISVAMDFSEDKYREQGGEIGLIRKGDIYRELEEAAEKLKPGEVSQAIHSEGMWFILRVDERIPGGKVPFEEVKADLKRLVEKKRSAELLAKWTAGLESKAKIDILVRDIK